MSNMMNGLRGEAPRPTNFFGRVAREAFASLIAPFKVRQKTIKSREARFLIIFAPLFLKSGWGFGGEAPENLRTSNKCAAPKFFCGRIAFYKLFRYSLKGFERYSARYAVIC